jgi:hypothetical protein
MFSIWTRAGPECRFEVRMTNAYGQDTLWFTDGVASRVSLAEMSDGAPIRVSMAETPDDGAAIRVLLAETPNGMGYKLTYADPNMSGYGRRSRQTVLCMTMSPEEYEKSTATKQFGYEFGAIA